METAKHKAMPLLLCPNTLHRYTNICRAEYRMRKMAIFFVMSSEIWDHTFPRNQVIASVKKGTVKCDFCVPVTCVSENVLYCNLLEKSGFMTAIVNEGHKL